MDEQLAERKVHPADEYDLPVDTCTWKCTKPRTTVRQRGVRIRTVRPLPLRVSPYISQGLARTLRLNSGDGRSTIILHTFYSPLLLLSGPSSFFARRESGNQTFLSRFLVAVAGFSRQQALHCCFDRELSGRWSCAFCDRGSYCRFCSFVMRYDGSSPHWYLSLYYHCSTGHAWHGVDRGVVAESITSNWEFFARFSKTTYLPVRVEVELAPIIPGHGGCP
jgi:hypothetical protein